MNTRQMQVRIRELEAEVSKLKAEMRVVKRDRHYARDGLVEAMMLARDARRMKPSAIEKLKVTP